MMVTLDEFREAVRRKFFSMNKIAGDEENRKFFESADTQNEIAERYKSNLKRQEQGLLKREIFLGDAASSVAYCLYMLY